MKSKALLSWFLGGCFINLWALVTCVGAFRWVYLVEPTSIFMSSLANLTLPFMAMSALNNFAWSGIAVLVYSLLQHGIPGRGIKKGFLFGFLLWLVGGLLPNLRLAITMNTSAPVVTYWMMNSLAIYMFLGAIVNAIYSIPVRRIDHVADCSPTLWQSLFGIFYFRALSLLARITVRCRLDE